MILDYRPHLPLDRLSALDLVKRRYTESQASVSGEPLECHPASLRRQGTFKAVRLAPVLFGDRVGRERSAVPRQQQPVKPVHTGTTSCPSVLQHVKKKKKKKRISTAFPKKQHLLQWRRRSENNTNALCVILFLPHSVRRSSSVYTPTAFKYRLPETYILCFYITFSHPQLVIFLGSKFTQTKFTAIWNNARH